MVIHGPCGDSMGYHFRDTRIIAGQPPMEMGNPGPQKVTLQPCFFRLRGKMEPAPTLRPLGFDETFKDSRFFLIVHPCSVAWDSWLYGRLQREVQVFLHLAGAGPETQWIGWSKTDQQKTQLFFSIWRCLKMGPHGHLNGEDHHCPMGLGAPMATLFSDTPISHTNLVNIQYPLFSHKIPLNHHKFPLKSH